MAWHHVIPFALLREVWNRLVDQHIATQLPEARTALRQYLMLADPKLPNLESLLDRMRAENTGQRRARHHPPLDELSVAEAHMLATAAVWPAWNAVEGPARRSDDPRDAYFDRFTAGLTAAEAVRMRTVEWLFLDLQLFGGAGPAPGPESLRALTDAISMARPLLACDGPIRYRAEMWVEQNGLWRKRRDGERAAAGGA